MKQEELQAAVEEYQARQTRDSSTLTNQDGAPRLDSFVKEELRGLVAEYVARVEQEVKQEVKQEVHGDGWIKKEDSEGKRSTTAETEVLKHERRSETISTPSPSFTEDSKSHVVKLEDQEILWLKREEEDLPERSSVDPDHGWFKRENRYEGTVPRRPKRPGEVKDPRLSKRIKSGPQ